MRSYDCTHCIFAKEYFKQRRTCYLYEQFPDGSKGHKNGDAFAVPQFEDVGVLAKKPNSGEAVSEIRFLEEESFIDMVAEIADNMPHMSAFQVRQLYFQEVCPTAFADPVMRALIETERSAREYTIDISKDEVREKMLGFQMDLGDMLEAFSIIQGTRNDYERWRMDELDKKAKERQAAGGGHVALRK